MGGKLDPDYRNIYVNGTLEFSLFYDPLITDKNTIINQFIEDREWKFFIKRNKFKVTKISISNDLKIIKIVGKED